MPDTDDDQEAPVRVPGPRGPERTEAQPPGTNGPAGSGGAGSGGGLTRPGTTDRITGAGGGEGRSYIPGEGGGGDWRAAARGVERTEQQDGKIKQAIAKTAEAALDTTAPIVTTHSHGVDALFAAQEISLKSIIADLDAKIALLNAERTDAMLAYSMLSAGRAAKDRD